MKEKRANDQEKKVRNQYLNQDKNQVSGSYFFFLLKITTCALSLTLKRFGRFFICLKNYKLNNWEITSNRSFSSKSNRSHIIKEQYAAVPNTKIIQFSLKGTGHSFETLSAASVHGTGHI